MTIRRAVQSDLAAIQCLAGDSPEAPHWPSTVYESFLTTGAKRLFIAESTNVLTGFIAGSIVLDICELESVAVHPTRRRTGAATALLAALKFWAFEHRASRVQLEVRAENSSAIAFYLRAGFHQDGLRPGYYSDPPDDAVLMSLPLTPPPHI